MQLLLDSFQDLLRSKGGLCTKQGCITDATRVSSLVGILVPGQQVSEAHTTETPTKRWVKNY